MDEKNDEKKCCIKCENEDGTVSAIEAPKAAWDFISLILQNWNEIGIFINGIMAFIKKIIPAKDSDGDGPVVG